MIARLWSQMGKFKKYILFCVLLTVGEVICELLLPLMMSKIVDVGIPTNNIGYMAGIGGVMVVLSALAIVFGIISSKASAEASQGFSANIRRSMFNKIEAFSFENIDHFSSASLITRMTNDVNQLQNTMMMAMRMLTRAPIMLVCAFAIAISINFKLSLIIFAAIIVIFALIPLLMKAAHRIFSEMQTRIDAVNSTVRENLVGIRVVKAFVRDGYERTKFAKSNDAFMETAIKAGNIMAMTMPIMSLIINTTIIAVIWVGGNFIGTGEMATGELMGFISYIMQIFMSVMFFSMIFVMVTRARACVERIFEVVDTRPTISDDVKPTTAGKNPEVKKGSVEFKDVTFRYDDKGGNILDGVSFKIDPGEIVGIVGGTGSGKTTLVSLIPRFYDVFGGEVLVDGIDVRDYVQQDLRAGIGMVMQQNNLFTGTIRDNLLWGGENATDEDVERAAMDAQAHGFISSFPGGYNTVLGQGGVNMSGGQKQRLCIARAMLKKPRILILDDSTSAVDTATEAAIRKSFYKSLGGTTVIIVAQRISSVRAADKIIVLDDGAVAGIGSHDDLYATNDIYREICVSQTEEVNA